MKEITKIVAVLAGIAVIAGGLLGLVYSFTYISSEEKMNGKLSAIYDATEFTRVTDGADTANLPNYDALNKGLLINVYRPVDESGTLIFHTEGKEAYKGTLELLIITRGSKIVQIEVYEHGETPGLGTKAFDGYLDQFKGDISDIDVFALSNAVTVPNDIIAVTGATKSSKGVLNAVNIAVIHHNFYADGYLSYVKEDANES